MEEKELTIEEQINQAQNDIVLNTRQYKRAWIDTAKNVKWKNRLDLWKKWEVYRKENRQALDNLDNMTRVQRMYWAGLSDMLYNLHEVAGISRITKDKAGNYEVKLLRTSAWRQGVVDLAEDMLYKMRSLVINDALIVGEEESKQFPEGKELERLFLRGAKNWRGYSYDGEGYIFNQDIAVALCTPGELVVTRYGRKEPNKTENWLDVQARALSQASDLLLACRATFD